MSTMEKQGEFARVFSFIKRKPLYISSILIDAIIRSVCFNIILAFITQNMFNAAIKGDMEMIRKTVLYGVIAFVLGATLQPIVKYIVDKCVKATMNQLRITVFKDLHLLSMNSYEDYHSGELTSRLTNDLSMVEAVYSTQMRSLVFAIVHGLIAIGALFYLEWRVSILIIIMGILTLLINVFYAKKLRKFGDIIQKSMGNVTEKMIDLIQSLPVAKMFQIEKKVFTSYESTNFDMTMTAEKRAAAESQLTTLNFMFGNFKNVGVLCFGLFLLFRGQMEVGTVVAIIYLQGNANYLFDNVGTFVADIQRALAGASRVFEILDLPKEINLYNSVETADYTYKGEMVKLENVEFSFNKEISSLEDEKVLKGVNISVKNGSVTALVGPSGGGKSSILKLIMGFYPIDKGNIIVGEKLIQQYSLEELRSMTAYVPQDPYLFYGSILENIKYGNPNASNEEIISAATAANAHEFITNLPMGYETLVGERGESLSGGQRQRIAIARALLKNAPILLLDEATSALDSESEQLVQDALKVLMEGRTTLVIAHRLSTIINADQIYVIDKGEVVEAGTHQHLLEKEGLYKKLFDLQFDANRGICEDSVS